MKKIVITKYSGGLGNQMFQYAAARAVAHRENAELLFDLSHYAIKTGVNYTIRSFALEQFSIFGRKATMADMWPLLLRKYRKGKVWFLWNKLVASRKRYFSEKQFHFDPDVLALHAPVFLDGWFASEKYFTDIRNVLLKEFTLVKPLSSWAKVHKKSIQGQSASVAVHIRRGDYVKNPETNSFHGVCSNEYYEKAAAQIIARYPQAHFYIFSDEIEWVRTHMKFPGPVTYVSEANDVTPGRDAEEMFLISMCKHAIIANSTFSWWGAWLNTNPHKMVIGPKRWFDGAKKNVLTHDVLPSSWISLEV
jgi:hypothetical protein